MSKKSTPTRKRVPVAPFEPRIDGALHQPSLEELLEADQWTRSSVTGDLSGRQLRRVDIAESRLRGCRLTGADLQGARLVDVELVDCELSGASLVDATLTRVALHNCRLSGTLLTTAKLRDVAVVECRADELSMRMTVSERVTWERTMLREADFYSARLEVCRLFDCDLTGVQFSKAVFHDTRLHGSDLSGLRGIEYVRGVAIDPDQVHDFTTALLAAHNISVDHDREPAART